MSVIYVCNTFIKTNNLKQFAETELGVTRMNLGQQNNIELRLISLAVHAVSLRYNFFEQKIFLLTFIIDWPYILKCIM